MAASQWRKSLCTYKKEVVVKVVLLAKVSQNNTSKKRGFRWFIEVDFSLKSMCYSTTRDGGEIKKPLHVSGVAENQARKEEKAWPGVAGCA